MEKIKNLPYIIYAVLRVILQITQLMVTLFRGNYEFILMQNPPCIPLMFVIVVYKFFQRIFQSRTTTKFIIDWHNYGYSIMRANKVSAPLCVLGKIYEGYFGKFGDYHLTVS